MARYRLHNRLGSGGFPIQAVLAAAEVEFEFEPMDSVPNEPLGRRIAHLNAWGQVPVLELDDGTKITEVAAILAYLAEAEPALAEGPVFWIDNRALFHRWTVFLAVNVYEGILRQTYCDRYFDGASDALRTRASDLPEDVDALIAGSVRQSAKGHVHRALQCIEAETAGHRFLLGDRLSPCDVFLAMLYAWHNQKPDLPKCTWITTQVATHGAMRAIWAQNFGHRLDFKWHEL